MTNEGWGIRWASGDLRLATNLPGIYVIVWLCPGRFEFDLRSIHEHDENHTLSLYFTMNPPR